MAGEGHSKRMLESAIAAIADRLDCILHDYYPDPPARHNAGPQRYIFSTGAHALGLWSPGDEVHLVALTNNTAKIFWSFVAEKLDLEVLPETVHAQARLELEDGIWLHYCAMPKGFDMATVSGYGFPEYAKDAFQPSAVRQNLDLLRDTKYLLNQCGQIDMFRAAYIELRRWAEDAGLWSSDFGLLTPETLLWLVFKVWSQDPRDIVNKCLTRLQDPSELAGLSTPSDRAAYSAPAGLSADNRLAVAGVASIVLQPPSQLSREDYFARFVESGQIVRVHAWCFSIKDSTRFQSKLVRLIASLRISLGQTVSSLRIWPYSLRSTETEWMYLVSMAGDCDSKAVEQVGTEFLEKLDGTGGIAFDMPERGEDRDPLQHADGMSYQVSRRFDRSRFMDLNITGAQRTSSTAESVSELITTANGKQPSASHVLSRLRWDPAYVNESYEVGYLDRFEGIKWLPLELWGKATEDEDFIPEHRIRVFRKIGVGKKGVVWERIGREGVVWSG